MKIVFFIFLGLLVICNVQAQLVLKGKIVDEKNLPLASVNVTLSPINSNIVLAYSITNKNGLYSISWQGKDDSVKVNVSSLGFAKKEIIIPTVSAAYDFILSPQAITLPEVKVKTPPVWQRKDTINYNTSEFKQQQDRVIGDIIARLPGIEVSPNGQIKYNGKPINKYYIEGLDLLEDKYGLANNNIPADAVEKVQVLENHQPIRILDSVSFSDRAAINIKLKSNAKMRVIGRAKIGVGASPFLSENEATPMLFKKKLQFINTYKYNNTGLDNLRELSSHNIFEYINAIQNGTIKRDLVNVVQPSPPSFSPQRYLFNNVHVASVNLLISLKKDYQLRINTSYVNDFQEQLSNVVTKFYLPADTVTISEQNNYNRNQNKVQTDITLMANTPKFYLKNNLQLQGWWQSEKSRVLNVGTIYQQLSNPYYSIANDFKLLKTKAKIIVEFGSYIGYVSLPQNLTIYPGLYQSQLNNNIPYDGLYQKAGLQTLYTDNYISIRKRKSKFGSQYKLGFNIQQQEFTTSLQTIQSNVYKSIADTFQNNLKWNRYVLYANNSWSYETNKIRLSFSLPVNATNIEYSDTGFKSTVTKNRLFINPSLSLMYQLTPKWNFNSSASFANSFDDINGITSGYILKTYRNLSNNNAPLAESQNISISTGITFRNPLKIVFFNSSISYSRNKSNLLYRQLFNGSLESLIALLQDNYTNRVTISGRFSKYIIDWKTSFGFNYGYTFGSQQQLQQNSLVTFSNKNYNTGITISSKLSAKFTTDYAANYFTYSSASQLQKVKNTISSANQNFSINYFPTNKWVIRFVAEHYYFNSQLASSANYLFGDMNLRYKPKKSKIDYELALQNIFNTKSFTSAVLLNNIESVSAYELRPRQALFKVSFSF
ncbi:MAG: TonB-dependent receptor [Chitinophagaceae bacterium]